MVLRDWLRAQGFKRRLFWGIVAAFCIVRSAAAQGLLDNKLPAGIEGIGIREKLGVEVDRSLQFTNEDGQKVSLGDAFDGQRPVALFFVYYTCPSLCNLFLNGALESLKTLQWSVGKEFNIVTVSMDPRETHELAREKKANYLAEYARVGAEKGWHFWVNDQKAGVDDLTNVKRLAEQVGFSYKYEQAKEQFAHAAGMILVSPKGKVTRYLYGIHFPESDLRLALTEAGDGKIGTVLDHFMLFCYNYDSRTRKYSLVAKNLMRGGAGLTIVVLATSLVSLSRRKKRDVEV
jgi:protein SCO1/2